MLNIPYIELKDIFREQQAPYSFLFLDELDKNIQSVSDNSNQLKIRIATKSIRSLDVLRYVSAKLADKFIGLMSYHVQESIDLAKQGFQNIMIGYPQVPTKKQLMEIKMLKQEGCTIMFMLDQHEHIEILNNLASEIDLQLDVCIDIDMSLELPGLHFGVLRSSLNSNNKLINLLDQLKKTLHLNVVGVMGYEAQIAGVYDHHENVVKSKVIKLLKRTSMQKVYHRRKEFCKIIKQYFNVNYINGGGSGSIKESSMDESINELTIGSAFYCSHLFDRYNYHFRPSMGYAIPVSRIPQQGTYTCLGGGYIASGSIDRDKLPVVFSPQDSKYTKNEMFGEVQTPIKCSEVLKINDPVFLRHAKAGELLERFNDLLIIENKNIIGKWKTYRGEGKCYL